MTQIIFQALRKARKDGITPTLVSSARYLRNSLELIVKAKIHSNVEAPLKKLYVNPRSIQYYYPQSYSGSIKNHFGKVRGGKWDQKKSPITEHPKYKACKQRLAGKSWEETGIIDRMAKKLKQTDKNSIEHGCESREDLIELYTKRDELIRSLTSNGFDESISSVCCRVHIGRDGTMILASGGRHRLFLSQLLGINDVPIRILWRHKQWQQIREEIKTTKKYDNLSQKTKSQIDHPDIQELISNNCLSVWKS